MTEQEILKILEATGAIITKNHIVYTSGLHGEAYVNKDAIYPHTNLISSLCQEIARRFAQDNIEVVAAPALGGIILSQWTAHHLSQLTKKEILSVYAEKSDGPEGFEFRRGYDALLKSKNTLAVEDILTTGGSIKKAAAAIKRAGGNLLGVAALCNRGNITCQDLEISCRLETLVSISLNSWTVQDCPLCAQGIAVNTSVGKGKEFLKSNSRK